MPVSFLILVTETGERADGGKILHPIELKIVKTRRMRVTVRFLVQSGVRASAAFIAGPLPPKRRTLLWRHC